MAPAARLGSPQRRGRFTFEGGVNALLASLPTEVGMPPNELRVATVLVFFPLGPGLAIGNIVGGALRVSTGNYRSSLYYSAGCLACASACVGASMCLHRPPKRPR